MVGKRQLIGNVNDIISYTVSYNSTHVLCRWSSGLSIVKCVSLIGKEPKGHAHRNLKIMGKSINLAFHAGVIIERVAVKVAELRGVLL